MEWPVLGRARVATRKRCLPEDQPGPSKKPRKKQYHWNMKLAMVFEKNQLPESIEKLMESFLVKPPHVAFYKKYGNMRTVDSGGPGFINGGHPKIPHDKLKRWMWSVFRKERTDVDVTCDILKPLESKRAIVYYKARNQIQARDHTIRITHAGPNSMRVDDGQDTEGYTLSYRGVLEMSLHVEYPR